MPSVPSLIPTSRATCDPLTRLADLLDRGLKEVIRVLPRTPHPEPPSRLWPRIGCPPKRGSSKISVQPPPFVSVDSGLGCVVEAAAPESACGLRDWFPSRSAQTASRTPESDESNPASWRPQTSANNQRFTGASVLSEVAITALRGGRRPNDFPASGATTPGPTLPYRHHACAILGVPRLCGRPRHSGISGRDLTGAAGSVVVGGAEHVAAGVSPHGVVEGLDVVEHRPGGVGTAGPSGRRPRSSFCRIANGSATA